MELVGWVHPSPVWRALFMNLNDVTLNWASTISFRRSPGECDAALGLIFNLGAARWARRV